MKKVSRTLPPNSIWTLNTPELFPSAASWTKWLEADQTQSGHLWTAQFGWFQVKCRAKVSLWKPRGPEWGRPGGRTVEYVDTSTKVLERFDFIVPTYREQTGLSHSQQHSKVWFCQHASQSGSRIYASALWVSHTSESIQGHHDIQPNLVHFFANILQSQYFSSNDEWAFLLEGKSPHHSGLKAKSCCNHLVQNPQDCKQTHPACVEGRLSAGFLLTLSLWSVIRRSVTALRALLVGSNFLAQLQKRIRATCCCLRETPPLLQASHVPLFPEVFLQKLSVSHERKGLDMEVWWSHTCRNKSSAIKTTQSPGLAQI